MRAASRRHRSALLFGFFSIGALAGSAAWALFESGPWSSHYALEVPSLGGHGGRLGGLRHGGVRVGGGLPTIDVGDDPDANATLHSPPSAVRVNPSHALYALQARAGAAPASVSGCSLFVIPCVGSWSRVSCLGPLVFEMSPLARAEAGK